MPQVPVWRGKHYWTARGRHRVFNTLLYRFFASITRAPAESDTPFETNATLPHTTTATYTDNANRFAVSKFNGVLDSGFLGGIGPNGEHYARIDLSGGTASVSPPQKPNSVRLEKKASGVIRIVALVYLTGNDEDPDTFAITYTTNGSAPGDGSPDVTVAMTNTGAQVMNYDLPAQGDGTTVKVRVQTYRSGDTTYSETDATDILTETADATGPSAPGAGDHWTGSIP